LKPQQQRGAEQVRLDAVLMRRVHALHCTTLVVSVAHCYSRTAATQARPGHAMGRVVRVPVLRCALNQMQGEKSEQRAAASYSVEPAAGIDPDLREFKLLRPAQLAECRQAETEAEQACVYSYLLFALSLRAPAPCSRVNSILKTPVPSEVGLIELSVLTSTNTNLFPSCFAAPSFLHAFNLPCPFFAIPEKAATFSSTTVHYYCNTKHILDISGVGFSIAWLLCVIKIAGYKHAEFVPGWTAPGLSVR
jgi:hypothetical protein